MINDRGQVVGAWRDAGEVRHGFVWDRGSFWTFDHPNANSTLGQGTYPGGLKSRGDIVWRYWNVFGISHGFFRTKNGTYINIDHPDGPGTTWPITINGRGQIVGNFVDSGGGLHGFLYENGSYTTIDVPGADATDVESINDRGDIAGEYFNGSGGHGFVGVRTN